MWASPSTSTKSTGQNSTTKKTRLDFLSDDVRGNCSPLLRLVLDLGFAMFACLSLWRGYSETGGKNACTIPLPPKKIIKKKKPVLVCNVCPPHIVCFLFVLPLSVVDVGYKIGSLMGPRCILSVVIPVDNVAFGWFLLQNLLSLWLCLVLLLCDCFNCKSLFPFDFLVLPQLLTIGSVF